MGVPVVPLKVEGYARLFPRAPQFPYLPNRRGRFRLIIGEPITFSKSIPYEEATERARRALIATQ
jgi:1-acyl-sn-glycerol-3-phosphate acyltransferase